MNQAEETNQKSTRLSLQNANLDSSTSIVCPNVMVDNESNKEISTTKTSAVEVHIHSEAIIDDKSNMDEKEIDKVADTPIQDTVIFVQ